MSQEPTDKHSSLLAARVIDEFLRSYAPKEDLARPYINAKQYYRILKRLEFRRSLTLARELHSNDAKPPAQRNKSYESRQEHARRRKRNKDGKFTGKEKGAHSEPSTAANEEEETSSQSSVDSQSTSG